MVKDYLYDLEQRLQEHKVSWWRLSYAQIYFCSVKVFFYHSCCWFLVLSILALAHVPVDLFLNCRKACSMHLEACVACTPLLWESLSSHLPWKWWCCTLVPYGQTISSLRTSSSSEKHFLLFKYSPKKIPSNFPRLLAVQFHIARHHRKGAATTNVFLVRSHPSPLSHTVLQPELARPELCFMCLVFFSAEVGVGEGRWARV